MSNFSLEKYKSQTSLVSRNGNNSLSALRQSTNLNKQDVDYRINSLTTQVIQQVPAIFLEKSVELLVFIDRSTSCRGTEADTIEGYNNLIKREKSNGYPTKITTVLFDEEVYVLERRTDINKAQSLNYCADGGTAMYDALCSQIQKLKEQQELDKTSAKKTIVAIMTDGNDEHSKKYNLHQTRQLIQERQNAGWEFIFLATNINAKQVAANLGIKEQNSANYATNNHGILLNFEAISNVINSLRLNGSVDINWAKDINKNILALEDKNKNNGSSYQITRR